MFKRYLEAQIKTDLEKKIVLLSGPRQVGKTTLSKDLYPDYQYLNYDLVEHTKIMLKKEWDRDTSLLIFDEIHKMNKWKAWLKGIYDVEGVRPRILVTGSARLETFTNVGDSLAGRYFSFRLHPLDLKEIIRNNETTVNEREVIDKLINFSGFPEPFFAGNKKFYNRWQKSHLDVILREDFLGFLNLKDISKLKLLIDLLRDRVGSPLSYSSLANDLQTSHHTVKSWVELLEKLYIIFRVTPYSKNIARSILKEPKYYFYNNAFVRGDEGVKFENLVACALIKEVHAQTDLNGLESNLFYLKNKSGNEIDFFTVVDNEYSMIEVKNRDSTISKNFEIFSKYFSSVNKIQLVNHLDQKKSNSDGVKVEKATHWLKTVAISSNKYDK